MCARGAGRGRLTFHAHRRACGAPPPFHVICAASPMFHVERPLVAAVPMSSCEALRVRAGRPAEAGGHSGPIAELAARPPTIHLVCAADPMFHVEHNARSLAGVDSEWRRRPVLAAGRLTFG